jgi:outer membrane lipoprotein carrier protein
MKLGKSIGWLFASLLIAVSTDFAWASGLIDLEAFIKGVKSGSAEFVQVVTAPVKVGQAPRVKTSTGRFEFARPARFRFDYNKPFEQSIVADGQTLWMYDVDLNQVTTRKQTEVLGTTPAALIASAVDIEALKADFVLTDAPDKDGLQWVLATPKSKEGQLQSVKLGFRSASASATPLGTLEVLEILDSFGQRSVLTFKKFQINPALPSNVFTFKPPPGADVITQ